MLNTFRQLIPNIDEYLNNIGLQDWVNILREIFDEGLLELDKIIEEKTVNKFKDTGYDRIFLLYITILLYLIFKI
ncbi:hypothetical protein [Clostridium sp. K25]|uniref:hypothetical protein n=1 Tax=Clostridium sp. K25 TaxID=1443109 RepID=UPI00057F2234|nr:hypothetical protein [Clostridium sp. K25]